MANAAPNFPVKFMYICMHTIKSLFFIKIIFISLPLLAMARVLEQSLMTSIVLVSLKLLYYLDATLVKVLILHVLQRMM